jgi:hypothetical protein
MRLVSRAGPSDRILNVNMDMGALLLVNFRADDI